MMAEHSHDGGEMVLDAGSKSPVKIKKQRKVSLFKKSSVQEEGLSRSSGRKRKSGRDKKSDSREHVDLLESEPGPTKVVEADSQYDINSQEIEQKSAADHLSIKKVQKLNKELVKQNAQLSKSMDILKKERELLVGEKVKLKGENRILEKELKKVSSKAGLSSKKMSQSFDESYGDNNGELLEKINSLEDHLAERDRKVSLLRLRLEKSHMEILVSSEPEDNGDIERPHIINGGMLSTLERLIEEQDVSLRLRKENTELRARLTIVETDLERSQQQEMPGDPSPKSSRKRSSSFFKRGKKSTSSMPTRHAAEESNEGKADYTRSQSPDFLEKSESHHEHLDISVYPLLSRVNKESTISLPCYGSPTQSPNLPARNRDHDEIQTLQSSLRAAVEERNNNEEKRTQLERELLASKSKIKKLEESMLAMSKETNTEIEQLRKSLKMAEIDQDTYCDELKIAQQEGDEIIEKNEALEKMFTESLSQKNELIKDLEQQLETFQKNEALEKMFTESLSQKNELIKDQEQQLETLRKSTLLSPPFKKPPTGASSNRKQNSVSPSRDKILSPSSQSKDISLPKNSEVDKTGTVNFSEKKTERNTSTSESPKHERPLRRLSSHEKPPISKAISSSPSRKVSSGGKPETAKQVNETSHDKLKVVPPSPSRKSGRLSRETSVDKFETSRLSSETSHDKLSKAVPPSPSRKSGRLSRETSTDKLEVSKEARLSSETSYDKLSKALPLSPSRKSGSRLSRETSTDKLETSKEARLSSETSHDKLSKAVPLSPSRKSGRLSRETSADKLETSKEPRLSTETSHDKLSKAVPASPSRKVGRLSRESSIDQFEIPKEVKRKHSTSNVPHHSPSRIAKVAATRALFQQKIDETTSKQPPSNPSEKRRSSYCSDVMSSDTAKEKPQSHHSKSYSYDLSSKQIPKHDALEPLPPVPVDKSETVPPTTLTIGQTSEPTTSSNEAKSKINTTNHRQQDNRAAPLRGASTYPGRASDNVAKISRITITSTASPSSSPLLGNRKEISSSGAVKLQNSTSSPVSVLSKSPSPTSTGTKMLQAQPNSATKISTVSATIKHTKAVSVEESTSSHKIHHAVTKSNTEAAIKSPSNNILSTRYSSIWSAQPQSPGNMPPQSSRSRVLSATSTTTSTRASSPTTNKVIVKTSSTLGNNLLLSPVNKVASLQDIPSQIDASIDQKTAPKAAEDKVSTSSGIRDGPTHRVIQRRERKDRSKTMYASRAETTNLVNLISKFQEVEKEKKMTTPTITSVASAPSPSRVNGILSTVSTAKMNGTMSAVSTTTTPTISSSSSSSLSSSLSSSSSSTTFAPVTHRQHSSPTKQQSRPTTYYGGGGSSISTSRAPAPTPSYSKPKPHERKLLRSQTVAGGLGNNRLSKKAMLLKWCQYITEDYDNVSIHNFAESFSNGMAFCAMIHHFLPDQIPFNTLKSSNRENNFKLAFETAESAGIPSLLDVEDMVSLPVPDWMSVMTYVSFIYNKFGQQQNPPQQPQQSSMV